MNKLVIIGASGHGRVIADIATKNGYSEIIFLDDNTNVKACGEYRVVGNSQCAAQYKDSDFIIAIGNADIRRKIQMKLVEDEMHIVSLIHPDAVIADNVEIGTGTVVMAGAVINPYVKIGQGCIINTCTSVDHDCVIGDFVHVSVGSHIAGTVVIKSIKESATYIGVQARKMENMNKFNV